MKHHASPSFCMAHEDTRPVISVIVPAYNAAAFLPACADSLFCQTEKNFELILIDDGSADATADVCAALARRDDRVRIIRHENNRGISAARNTGIRAAQGRYIAFADADDRVLPEYLGRLLSLCCEHGTPMAACNHWIVRGDVQRARFPQTGGPGVMDAQEAARALLYQQAPDVSCWGKLFARELFDGLAFPEGKIYEDSYLFGDLLLRAGRMAYTPEPLYAYVQRGDSISHGTYTGERMQYAEAVERLCAVLTEEYPALEKAAVCRRAHAYMSVRRYLVRCPKALRAERARLEKTIRNLAPAVIADGEAPGRDRIAAAALLIGPWAYDVLWSVYEAIRAVR